MEQTSRKYSLLTVPAFVHAESIKALGVTMSHRFSVTEHVDNLLVFPAPKTRVTRIFSNPKPGFERSPKPGFGVFSHCQCFVVWTNIVEYNFLAVIVS